MFTAKLLRLTLAAIVSWSAWAATLGKVVQIGGHASDIALDERRGLLYIANFTANRIEAMSTSDFSLQTPLPVPPQPGSIALSPDGRYLVVAHYAKWLATGVTIQPAITVLDLDGATKQTLATGSSPLAVAFGGGTRALVVSATGFQLLDPATGVFENLLPKPMSGGDLPAPIPKFPPQIVQASVGVSGDKRWIVGVAGAEEQDDTLTVHFRFDVTTSELEIVGFTSSPPLGPRVVSVNQDATSFLTGWAMTTKDYVLTAQFPYAQGELNVGSHAFDWARSLVYAQIPEAAATRSEGTPPPVLHVADSDNLTVRERLQLPENLAGRSLLSGDMNTMYAVSDSGVMILPVGSLYQAPRVTATKEDVLFRGSFCDRRTMTQEVLIYDEGGGNIDFKVATTMPGITLSPSSGTTPAHVKISVDPNLYQNAKGTSAGTITITSRSAINVPAPIRVLINTREPEQRGALFNLPGKLVDILSDNVRDRFYVLRQDRNQVLVFNATTFEQVATLRTGNTPTQMAITSDYRFMMVANDNSQIANVYDLDLLQQVEPIIFPFGHYPRSIAASSNAILATVRGVSPGLGCPNGAGLHTIDRIDFETRRAIILPSLGVYCNDIPLDTVLTPTPSWSKIMAAMPDGKVLLYDASADTFVAARKDFDKLGGAYAALADQVFLVDNKLLNSSLVPYGQLATTSGKSSGFTILDGLGLRTTVSSPLAPGVLQRVDLTTLASIRPTKMIEAPLEAESLKTAAVGQIGQTILPFTRTLAVPANRATVVSLSVSGFTVMPWDYDAALAKPSIQSVFNLADGSAAVASGGLMGVRGRDLSRVTLSNNELPVPTTLGEACLTVNSVKAPLFMVSPGQINAQMPYEVVGNATVVLRTAGGMSDPFTLTVGSSAPAVFQTAVAGPETGLAALYRAVNGEAVTLANPIHPGDHIVIYATGLGRTSPPVDTGAAAPLEPLAEAIVLPGVKLGGVALPVLYAGLVPGQVGVYQINVYVPAEVPRGMQVPLVISRPEQDLTFSVRVVK
ncbi:MAG TPA: hypothetical protein VLH09_09740 [Bryobacteraceae bacterium]|nr:hypothetical protein [Bryobacteraceae bacterium]